MSGHTPWNQIKRKPHDDLQVNKREVFRFGDWSIYDATGIVTGSSPNEQWNSFIMHCRSWNEWTPVARPPANTYVKGETVQASDTSVYQIRVAKRCNANMTAEDLSCCPECGIKIPDEVVGLWKLQNFDIIQEFNSV